MITLLNMIRIGQTECIEAEGEVTTAAEGFAEAVTFEEITSETIALGEVAFMEVKLAQTRSAIYVKSQDADQQDTPLMNESKYIIGSVNMLLVLSRNSQQYIIRAS